MPKNNPHNALFVKTFSIRSEAKAFIQHFLPKWISESIDYRTFKQVTTSYVNEDLKEYFSDIVYECNWKGGKSIQISCLLEHKSFAPQNIYIQLNRYLTEGYQQQSLDKAKKKLTLILPIIIYHGQQKWQVREFTDYFELPDKRLKQFIPNYTYELVDLSKIPDDWMLKISIGHCLKNTFLIFKHKDDKDFLYQFQEGKKKGKEQGMKIKQAIISLRSLFLFFPLRSDLPIANIAKIADVKIDTVKKFIKA